MAPHVSVTSLVTFYIHFALTYFFPSDQFSLLFRFELSEVWEEIAKVATCFCCHQESRCEHWSDASPTCLAVTICMCAQSRHTNTFTCERHLISFSCSLLALINRSLNSCTTRTNFVHWGGRQCLVIYLHLQVNEGCNQRLLIRNWSFWLTFVS